MNSIIINVIIGVVSATLFALLVWLFKNHIRRFWFSTLGIKDLYNKLGVVKIFQRRSDAITFLFPNLLRSKYIKVFQFKGYSLLDSYNRIDTTLYKLASHPDSNIKKVSFLLLNPKNKKAYIHAAKVLDKVLDEKIYIGHSAGSVLLGNSVALKSNPPKTNECW